ncbi:MAG TPA: putative aminohydrolase SsnA [Anaerolineae bacterium]|nr:putative aminohydrolase SsnA [Anaerolineae bacterium]
MLITNARIATLGEQNEIIEDGALLIQGDQIADMGSSNELQARYPQAKRLDAGGQLALPGSICAHTHFYGAFARGMYIPGEPPKDFPEILRKLWWNLDKTLDEESIRYSALVCLVDAIRHGTTTLIDHHASPNAIDGSLDIIAEAVQEAGVRASLCYEVTDRDGPEKAKAGIAENVRFIRRTRIERNPKLAASFGLHASLTLSDETLAACLAEAEALGDVGFHIHAAEGPADQNDSLSKYGLRTIDRLSSRRILGPRTIVAHAVAIDAWEMITLRDTGTWVTHQPRSNMNNAVGVADVPALLRGGTNVGLGNDGFSNNMFIEMHVTYLLHKLWRGDPRAMPADQVVQMAYGNNGRLASLFFNKPLGELSVGAYADIALLDYHPTTPLTAANLPWHLIFAVDGSQVTTTICGGQLLMRDRQLLTLDEEAITACSRELAQTTWERFWVLCG